MYVRVCMYRGLIRFKIRLHYLLVPLPLGPLHVLGNPDDMVISVETLIKLLNFVTKYNVYIRIKLGNIESIFPMLV